MFKRSIGFTALIVIVLCVFFTIAQNLVFKSAVALDQFNEREVTTKKKASKPEPAPIVYGIPTDSLEIVEATIKRGQNLSQILADYNVSPSTVSELSKKAKKVFSVRRINAGRSYTLLHKRDSANTAQYFIYEPSPLEYIVYDLRGDLAVTKVTREIEVVEKSIAGVITNSLFNDLIDAGGSPQLVNVFADIYAWRLDLNRIQPGDRFKLIYEEKVVEGTTIGFGKIKSAYFDHMGDEIYAIAFEQENGTGYYDQDGKSLKKAFLREPLEYSRISSRYNLKRFHPVQKRYKPHLGTDFAARAGTPIRTVGDGVVLEARYTRGNGYYVKIRHNKTYTTQYLHMSKFAKNIKAGTRVKQGQTIGYVGSTGLATGPHLCYRFWKNGKQVDALRVQLPAADPINKKYMADFVNLKEEIVGKMEALDMKNAQPQDLLASEKQKEQKGA